MRKEREGELRGGRREGRGKGREEKEGGSGGEEGGEERAGGGGREPEWKVECGPIIIRGKLNNHNIIGEKFICFQ